jgi:hypothetical protein
MHPAGAADVAPTGAHVTVRWRSCRRHRLVVFAVENKMITIPARKLSWLLVGLSACAVDPDSDLAPEVENDIGAAAFAIGALGVSEDDDRFAAAVAAGDFDDDGRMDLAIGAPGEAQGSEPKSGVVFIFQGTSNGGLVPWRVLT